MTAATPDSATSPPAPRPRLARLKVDHAAIVENWRYFRKLAPAAAVAAVVKADAYGLGAVNASRALAQAGARVFFTATSAEALIVRKALGEGPQIFVLNGPQGDDIAALRIFAFGLGGLGGHVADLATVFFKGIGGPFTVSIDQLWLGCIGGQWR